MASISQNAAEELLRKIDRTFGAQWPVSWLPQVTSPFGWRPDPHEVDVERVRRKKVYHYGLDIRSGVGDPIRPIWPGVVIRVWYDDLNGNAIRILHLAHPEIISGYAHLDETKVLPGDIVTPVTRIALSGKTGKVEGAHLHFCVSVDRQWVDPTAALEHNWTVDQFAEQLAAGDTHPKI